MGLRSFFKKAGKVVSSNVRGLGRTVEQAAHSPIGQLVPGGGIFGSVIGGALAGRSAHDIAHNAGEAGKAQLRGMAHNAPLLLGPAGAAGLQRLGGSIPGVNNLDLPGLPNIPGLPQGVKDALGGALGGVGGALGGAAGWAGDNADLLLAGASGAYGVERGIAADRARREGIGLARGSYDERAPLRQAGVAAMLNPNRPSPSAAIVDPGNPFAAQVTPPSVASPAALDPGGPRPPLPPPPAPPITSLAGAQIHEAPPIGGQYQLGSIRGASPVTSLAGAQIAQAAPPPPLSGFRLGSIRGVPPLPPPLPDEELPMRIGAIRRGTPTRRA